MLTTLRSLIALPFTRLELPGWGRVYEHVIGGYRKDALWRDARPRIIRDKHFHQFRILDLAQWSDRIFFFLKRWYDLEAVMVMRAFLRPGQRVIDVGANYGHFTLAAAQLIGPTGQITAFEPNPAAFARLSMHLTLNRVGHVEIRNQGVADAPSTLTLNVPGINAGEASFGGASYEASTQVSCPIVRLDDEDWPTPVAFLKIDVEGFEVKVIEGARALIQSAQPLILAEVIGRHLGRADADKADLARLICADLGYRAYLVGLRGRGSRQIMTLTHDDTLSQDGDYLFVPPGRVDEVRAHM